MPVQHPDFDLTTREGRAISGLFVGIKHGIEDGDGWNGGDVVERLCNWFRDLGLDPDGRGVVGSTFIDVVVNGAADHLGEEWTAAGSEATGYWFRHDDGAQVDVSVAPQPAPDADITVTLDLSLHGSYSVEGPQPFSFSSRTSAAEAAELLADRLRVLLDVSGEWARLAVEGR